MAGDAAPPSASGAGPVAGPPLRLLVLTACLAFIGGAIDTVSFIGLNGLFTAHVTGNFVLTGAVMAGALHGTVTARLMTIPFFGTAVALARTFARWYRTRSARLGTSSTVSRRVLVTSLIGAQFVWLLIFMGLSHAAYPVESDTALSLIAGMCGVVAMGIQNACSKLIYSAELVQTTVMTGNTTQLCVDLVDVVAYRCYNNGSGGAAGGGKHYELEMAEVDPALAAKQAEARKAYAVSWSRFQRGLSAVTAFVAGALCSAVLFKPIGFWAVLFPAALLPVVWWLCVSHPDLCAAAPTLPVPTPRAIAAPAPSSAATAAADEQASSGSAATAAEAPPSAVAMTVVEPTAASAGSGGDLP